MLSDLDHIIHLSMDMENLGKVDDPVIPFVEKVLRFAEQREREARKSPASLQDRFVTYHAWRNIGQVLQNLDHRFKNAATAHDNPQVALDALDTLPQLHSLAALIISLENRNVDYKTRMLVLEQVSLLRATARRCNLLVKSKEEMRSASKSFAKDLADFVGRVESKAE